MITHWVRPVCPCLCSRRIAVSVGLIGPAATEALSEACDRRALPCATLHFKRRSAGRRKSLLCSMAYTAVGPPNDGHTTKHHGLTENHESKPLVVKQRGSATLDGATSLREGWSSRRITSPNSISLRHIKMKERLILIRLNLFLHFKCFNYFYICCCLYSFQLLVYNISGHTCVAIFSRIISEIKIIISMIMETWKYGNIKKVSNENYCFYD